jgi:hypothetical protein
MIHRTYDKFGNIINLGDYIHYKTTFMSILCRVIDLDDGKDPYYPIRGAQVYNPSGNNCMFATHEISRVTEQEAMHMILSENGIL